MKINKYLPIGTVVLLENGKKRVMITGYVCRVEEENKIFDYSGCLFPEGIITNDKVIVFNHDQIAKIYHLGLVDEEQNELNTKLVDIVK